MNSEDRVPGVGDLLSLDGHSVLVTGASGNIGAGIARRLAEAGAEVIIHYASDEDGATETARAISEAGGAATIVGADLAPAEAAGDMFRELAERGRRVDDVVNNAAIQPLAALSEISPEAWRNMFAANLESAFTVTQAAARAWRERGGGGSVVNVASIEGFDPAPGHAHYAASKAGLLMFTRCAALEYGREGIRVNAVSPGLIGRDGLERDWPEGVARWRSKAPLARLGEATDVADAVLFLLSPAARWITGANLVVDGGISTVSRW